MPVGKLIALFVEEGDDISSIEIPKDEESSQPKPVEASSSQSTFTPPSTASEPSGASSSAPASQLYHGEVKSSRPLFPSVLRILQENGITDAEKIKGTGVRGMVTKGDVLTFLGKASGPLGTWKQALEKEEAKMKSEKSLVRKAEAQTPAPPLDGPALRRLIVSNMLEASQRPYRPGASGVATLQLVV